MSAIFKANSVTAIQISDATAWAKDLLTRAVEASSVPTVAGDGITAEFVVGQDGNVGGTSVTSMELAKGIVFTASGT